MSNVILLSVAAAILWTYVVDLLCRRWVLPSVIPLVLTGLVINGVSLRHGIVTDWVTGALPLMGTVGLVLVVLDGSMDLTLSRRRLRLALTSLAVAGVGFLSCVALLAWLAWFQFGLAPYTAVALAIPFAVISSAVAIPSARGLSDGLREFVVYESSISDVLGVLMFFAWMQGQGNAHDVAYSFLGGGLISMAVSALLSFGLFMVVNHLKGHVRFVPILACLFLLYAAGKWLHLSPLLLVFCFGLLMGNAQLLRRWSWLDRWMSSEYEESVIEFKQIINELEFAVRGLFFIMLGLWTPLPALLDWRAWATAVSLTCIIFSLRYLVLRLFAIRAADVLVWLAPRGLITVLLILYATETMSFAPVPVGAIMLTVLLTCVAVLASRNGRVSSSKSEAGATAETDSATDADLPSTDETLPDAP